MADWAIRQVPSERLLQIPPHSRHPNSNAGFKTFFGGWPATRQLFHLAFYEETYAIPAMDLWLGGPHPHRDLMFPDVGLEDEAWEDALGGDASLDALLPSFHAIRERQIQMLADLPRSTWRKRKLETALGSISAEQVVTKTIQHTLVHVDKLLRIVLFWDGALEWLDDHPSPESR